MRRGNASSRFCLSVSVCSIGLLTSESIDLETSFLARRYAKPKVEYRGHGVKVKVTGEKTLDSRVLSVEFVDLETSFLYAGTSSY